MNILLLINSTFNSLRWKNHTTSLLTWNNQTTRLLTWRDIQRTRFSVALLLYLGIVKGANKVPYRLRKKKILVHRWKPLFIAMSHFNWNLKQSHLEIMLRRDNIIVEMCKNSIVFYRNDMMFLVFVYNDHDFPSMLAW